MFTFLFTDIEGSTALWEQEPQAMRVALVRHNTILSEICEVWKGNIFKTLGDGWCIVWPSAVPALMTAIMAQRRFGLEPWPPSVEIRVRMALYTGTTVGADTSDYLGPVLNRVARMRDAAHGGQVLLSLTTIKELGLEPDVTEATIGGEKIQFVDQGEQQFRGVMHTERVYQATASGLVENFPPLRTLALETGRPEDV
jgi:class 3 adenylate cyclase